MTKDEVAQIVHGMPEGMHIDDYLVELVNRAVAVEREWVGLTDKELSLLWLKYHGDNFIADGRIINYEKAIEAKLKEKNGG